MRGKSSKLVTSLYRLAQRFWFTCSRRKLNTLLRRVGTRRWREPRMALVPWGHVAPVEGTVGQGVSRRWLEKRR